MAAITEDYVSFETAKLLKEKGFDQNCATYYLDGQVWRHYHGEVIPKGKQIYAAPTQAVAMKWLREVHEIDIIIFRHIRGKRITFFDRIEKRTHVEHQSKCNLYLSYEQACETAIKYCLENLI